MEKVILDKMNGAELLQKFSELGQSVNELKELVTRHTKADTPRTYLTRKETAHLLHVTLATLSRWEKCGILQPKRVGARVYYSNIEVENALRRA